MFLSSVSETFIVLEVAIHGGVGRQKEERRRLTSLCMILSDGFVRLQ